MRPTKTAQRLTGRLALAILALCLFCLSGCSTTKPVVLAGDERVFVVRDGWPTFDGERYEWAEVEGYIMLAPSQAYYYYQYLLVSRDARERSEVPDQ